MKIETVWIEIVVGKCRPGEEQVEMAKEMAQALVHDKFPGAVLADEWPDMVNDEAYSFCFCWEPK